MCEGAQFQPLHLCSVSRMKGLVVDMTTLTSNSFTITKSTLCLWDTEITIKIDVYFYQHLMYLFILFHVNGILDTLLVKDIIGSSTRLRLIEIQTGLSYWKI